jgi:hypothetical protein
VTPTASREPEEYSTFAGFQAVRRDISI